MVIRPRPGLSLHRRWRPAQAITNPRDRRLGRQRDAGPGIPSAPPHERERSQAAREHQAAYAAAATKLLPAFAGQNGTEGAIASAQWMPVKAQAIGASRLDVSNDASAVSPHKKGNAGSTDRYIPVPTRVIGSLAGACEPSSKLRTRTFGTSVSAGTGGGGEPARLELAAGTVNASSTATPASVLVVMPSDINPPPVRDVGAVSEDYLLTRAHSNRPCYALLTACGNQRSRNSAPTPHQPKVPRRHTNQTTPTTSIRHTRRRRRAVARDTSTRRASNHGRHRRESRVALTSGLPRSAPTDVLLATRTSVDPTRRSRVGAYAGTASARREGRRCWRSPSARNERCAVQELTAPCSRSLSHLGSPILVRAHFCSWTSMRPERQRSAWFSAGERPSRKRFKIVPRAVARRSSR